MEPSTWTPHLVDTTLRQWDRWRSLAEGVGSSVPDAHRSAKGKRYDPLTHADRCADVDKALRAVVEFRSLEWRILLLVRAGHPLGRVALHLHLRKADTLSSYDDACERMARYLGWAPEPPEPPD